MEKELTQFIVEKELSPFSKSKTSLSPAGKSIFRTRDARAVFTKFLSIISRNFKFKDTENLLQYFSFIPDPEEIKKRQEFFKGIPENLNNEFLNSLKKPNPLWMPSYDIVVVTEEDETFKQLKDLGVPVKILITDNDVLELQERDIVQVIDCPNFSTALEHLPQSVFLNSVKDAYLERYVEILSGWGENLEILKGQDLGEKIREITEKLESLKFLTREENEEKLTKEIIDLKIEEINSAISEKMKEKVLSGEVLMNMLGKNQIPDDIKLIVKNSIKESGLPEHIILQKIPVSADEVEVENFLREQDLRGFTGRAEEVKSKSKELQEIPKILDELSRELLIFDFKAGISKWMLDKSGFPEIGDVLEIREAGNEFLEKPTPINFLLNFENRCSILTGANSGGKTTLLEHLIQIISALYLGLPLKGEIKAPLFSDVYYFAKNKGSMNKGAFETLLTQMSEINPGEKTLILADEIESVTEPGVAGKMISATADYFVKQNCFLVIATHLGQEIQKSLPSNTRIDGIEASGLDENNELIVNHNPVLGRLAHSTPELIVEKMAKVQGGKYFEHLHGFLKGSGD